VSDSTSPDVSIIVNFKTYLEGTGSRGIAITEAARLVSEEFGVTISVAPPLPEISLHVGRGVQVFGQHCDAMPAGSHTGHVLAESLKSAGAVGTLLNHSECRMRLADIAAAITMCRDAGLKTVVCTNDIATTGAAAALRPDMLAIEPPELIGSGRAVSTTDPAVVSGAVAVAAPYDVPVLCGAGISKGVDLVEALKLGASGVLLASGIVKSESPEDALRELVSGI